MYNLTHLFLRTIKLSVRQMKTLRHKRLESNHIATKAGLGKERRTE